jgi:hypothetical protein
MEYYQKVKVVWHKTICVGSSNGIYVIGITVQKELIVLIGPKEIFVAIGMIVDMIVFTRLHVRL